MKKLISFLSVSTLLLSLASCSEKNDQSALESQTDTTSLSTTEIIETTTSTISEETEALVEIPLYSKDLNSTLNFDNFSITISKDWVLDSEDEKETIYDISENAIMSIETSIDRVFKSKVKKDVLTNDDYIDYRISENSYLQTYQTTRSIPFLCNKNDDGSYYEYQFYNNGKVYNLTFRAYSHHFFSQESIDNVIDSISLNEESSTSEAPASSASSLTFSGNGDTVTEKFTAPGCTIIKGEYKGDSTFIVDLYDSEGNLESYIFSNLGVYSGQKIFKFESEKQYMFEVTARDGDWSITVE